MISITEGIEKLFCDTVNCCSQVESSLFCDDAVMLASGMSGLEGIWACMHMGQTYTGFCCFLAWSIGVGSMVRVVSPTLGFSVPFGKQSKLIYFRYLLNGNGESPLVEKNL